MSDHYLKRRAFLKQASLAGISTAIGLSALSSALGKESKQSILHDDVQNYLIGVGKADITDASLNINLQGFAVADQLIKDYAMCLNSRAFIIANPEHQNQKERTLIVVADIWACTLAIKNEVISRIEKNPVLKGFYTEDNIIISGTHTHSAAGGFSEYFLYNVTGGGFDLVNVDIIVTGIMNSILRAHQNLSPGKIYINKGEVFDCGRNRSIKAYRNNPASERRRYKSSIDKNMVLLKFVKQNKAVGILNWYGVHGATLGKENTCVSGDNKGWAARKFEQIQNPTDGGEEFVAAFANATAGDVSTNVNKKYKGMVHSNSIDMANLEKFGNNQYEAAKYLFDTATEELIGPISFKHSYINMTNIEIASDKKKKKRTWPAALGVSFAAGSTEDGGEGLISEGIRSRNLIINTINSILVWDAEDAVYNGTVFNIDIANKKNNVSLDKLSAIQPGDARYDAYVDYVNGHYPKPILMPVGWLNNELYPTGDKVFTQPWVPETVPIQLIQIGQLVLTGFPGEITTMAGRRLRNTIKEKLGNVEVVIGAYANEYSGYVTTMEEYNKQNYEGASTLFGPHTLEAYQQEFSRLSTDLLFNQMPNSAPAAIIDITHYHERSEQSILGNDIYVLDESIKYFYAQTTQPVGSDRLRSAIHF